MKIFARDVANTVASHCGLTFADLAGPNIARAYVRPRQIAFYCIHRLCNVSYPAIGRMFSRDHTTVLYGVRKIEEMLHDETVAKVVNAVMAKFDGDAREAEIAALTERLAKLTDERAAA